MFSFEKLIVYQKSRFLVKDVYKLVQCFPEYERFALCSQLRRSIVSVPSNIAEQTGRTSVKEKQHFLEIANGSLMEAYCQLQLAVDLNYITEEDLHKLRDDFHDVSRLIKALSNSYG